MPSRRTTDGAPRGTGTRILVAVLAVQVVLAAALIAWVVAGSPLP